MNSPTGYMVDDYDHRDNVWKRPSSKLQPPYQSYRPKTAPLKTLQQTSPTVAPSRIHLRVRSMGNCTMPSITTPVPSSSSSSVSSSTSLKLLPRFKWGANPQSPWYRRRMRKWRHREGRGHDYQYHDYSSTDSSSYTASSSSSNCSINTMTDHHSNTAVVTAKLEQRKSLALKSVRNHDNNNNNNITTTTNNNNATSNISSSSSSNRWYWKKRSSNVLDGNKFVVEPSAATITTTEMMATTTPTTTKQTAFGDLHYVLAAKLMSPFDSVKSPYVSREEGKELEADNGSTTLLGDHHPINHKIDNHKVSSNYDAAEGDEYDDISIVILNSAPIDHSRKTIHINRNTNNISSTITSHTTPTTTPKEHHIRQRRMYEEISEWNNLAIEASSKNPALASSYFRTAHRLWDENVADPTAMADVAASSISSTLATMGRGVGGGDDHASEESKDEEVEDSDNVPPPFREIRIVIAKKSQEPSTTTTTTTGVRSSVSRRIRRGRTAAAVRDYVRRRKKKGGNEISTNSISSNMATVAGAGGDDVRSEEEEREDGVADDSNVVPSPCREIRVPIPDSDRSSRTVSRKGRKDVINEGIGNTRGDGTNKGEANDEETVIVDNSSSSSTPPKQRGYIYQRMEFDEGMHAFQHLEPLPYHYHHTPSSSATKKSTTDTTSTTAAGGDVVISPTLWYNRSQIHATLHEWSNAYDCLEKGR